MSDNIEYIDFEFESIKDSILDSRTIKKDKLDLIIKYLENCNNIEECLLSGSGKTTLMKKLATKWDILVKNERISSIVYSNPKILLEAIYGNINSVLYNAPESVFSMLFEGRNIVEYIFESKKVKSENLYTLLKFPNIFEYIKKYKRVKDLENLDLNKYLLDKKNDKLLLDELIDSGINKVSVIYYDDVIQEIINRNAFNLLGNVSFTKLINDYILDGKERALIDIMCENNVDLSHDTLKQFFKYSFFKNQFGNALDIMFKYERFDYISYVLHENQLLYELNSGNCVLEEMLINDCPPVFHVEIFDSRLISLILEYGNFEFYSLINISSWLKMHDLNNSFLDILLFQDNDFNYNNLFFNLKDLTSLEYAKFVMCFAKHDMLDKIKYDLFFTGDDLGKSVLEHLIDMDAEFTFNNILSDKEKEKYNIDLINKVHEFKDKCCDLNCSVSNIIKEDRSKKYECGEILEEQQSLLDEFYNLMNDGNSSMEYVELCISVYKKLFSLNNMSAYDIAYLIEYKKEFPAFRIVESDNSLYSPAESVIYINSENPGSLMHELGHLIHFYIEQDRTPEGFTELIDSSTFTLHRHYNELKKLIKSTKEYSEKVIYDMFDENVSETYLEEIKEFLDSGDYSKKIVSKLLGVTSLESFIKKDKKIKAKMLSDYLIREDDASMTFITDILDAVTRGEYIEMYSSEYGHGRYYYKDKDFLVFCEVFADYTAIIKSPDSEKSISMLRKYVGDELVDFLDKYYKSVVLGNLDIYINNEKIVAF